MNTDVVVGRIDSDGNLTGYAAPNEPHRRPLGDATHRRPPGDAETGALPGLGPRQFEHHGRRWELLTDGVNDIVVGQFDVASPGVTLDDAVDLGEPGPTPMEVPGTLDFQAASPGVSLYRIHLDPGHFWRLGLEVTAERDGGKLDTALALFDDQGRPIATDEVGRKDFPKDPYLFAGLEPGTYYVGVSGVNNLPGPKGATIPRRDPPGR